ncbi:MAG: hypothetical protein M3340_00135 [Actinomycetota bacterium]|nr:hypothetical protein [Actinomycetota bacterium]
MDRLARRFAVLACPAFAACALIAPAPASAAAPINDTLALATALAEESSVSITGTNVDASAESGEPSHLPWDSARTSVWYSWTAPSSGSLTIRATSDINPAIAAYTGDTTVGLTRVPNQAQDWNGGPEQIRIRVEAGVTYRIALDSSWVTGTFVLSLELIGSPLNDDFDDAPPLVGPLAEIVGNTLGATQEPCEPVHDDNYYDPSVWYSWTAPADGAVVLDTAGSDFPTVLGIYTGDALCNLTRVVASRLSGVGEPAKRMIQAQAGVTYRIAVDGQQAKMGNYALSLRQIPPPANDLFANAEELVGTAASATGSNIGAGSETGEPNPSWTNPNPTVWYSWTAPVTGTVRVTFTERNANFGLTAYTGPALDSLTQVARDHYGEGMRFGVEQGTTYRFAVDGSWSPSQGEFTLSLAAAEAPANDNFAASTVLTGESLSATGSTLGATRESGEPTAGYSYGTSSIWYSWTAPATGGVTIDTTGSDFDAVVAVYTGDAVGSLSQVTFNHEVASGTRTGRATFRAEAGTTYRIQVDGHGYGQEGTLQLALSTRDAPVNDMVADALPLASESSVATTGHNLGASVEASEPSHYGWSLNRASVWYSWTAPSSGSLTIRSSASFQTVLAAYTGDGIAGLTRVTNQAQDWNGGPEQIRIRVEAGATYRIAVDTLHAFMGDFTLSLELIESPDNDDFADAVPIEGSVAEILGDTLGATQEACEPVHDDNYYDPSVWYTWTAPKSGGVLLDTAGSDFPTVLGVYTGDALCSLTRVVTRALSWAGQPAKRGFRAVAGVTYRIAIDGQWARMGNYKLSLTHSDPPANDLIENAQELTGETPNVSGTNFGATGEPEEPLPSGPDGASVWYEWTAPGSGTASLSLPSRDFEAGTVVYTGDTIGALTEVARGGSWETVNFRAVAGTTYRIAVHGGSGPAQGDFSLSLRVTEPPPNDDLADAQELTGESGSQAGTTVGATRESDEPLHYYWSSYTASVWYRWTAPTTGVVDFRLQWGYSSIAGYTGGSMASLQRVASGEGWMRMSVDAGTTYLIAVASPADGYGSFTLDYSSTTAPENDDFADAAELSGESDTASASTNAASREAGEPYHYSSGSASIWYRWTAPSNGRVTVDLSGSGFDTTLAAYTGSDLGGLTFIANDDDTGEGSASRISIPVERGVTYRFAVDGLGYSRGWVQLALSHVPDTESTGGDPPVGDTPYDRALDDPPSSDPPSSDPPSSDPPSSDPPSSDPPSSGPPSSDPPAGDPPADDPALLSAPSSDPTASDPPTGAGDPPSGDSRTSGEPSDPSASKPPTGSGQESSAPFELSSALALQKLPVVLAKGLTGTATCSLDCSIDVVLTVDAPAARKLGLRGSKLTVARAATRGSAGMPARIHVRFPKPAAKKLRRAKSVPVTVTVTARSGAATDAVTRRLKLRR